MIRKEIIINDLRVKYFESENFNKENAFIFLHGWKSESSHLKPIFENLNNYIALDLPGFGGSDLPKEAWGTGGYANFLKSFLNKLEVQNPILVGHSFGGAAIIKYIADGGIVKKIILIDSAGIRKNGIKIQAYKVIAKIFKLPFYLPGLNMLEKRFRKGFYRFIDSEDYIEAGNLTESYKKIIREDLSEEMGKINIPTILIWGENDKATPISNAKEMNELIRNSELHIIKNAGHFSFIDQKEEFNKIFLNVITND